jgi:polysaccharide export outer membrane protein
MRRWLLFGFLICISSFGLCQTQGDPLAPDSEQNSQTDCSTIGATGSSNCDPGQHSSAAQIPMQGNQVRMPVLSLPTGSSSQEQNAPPVLPSNPSQSLHMQVPLHPETEFEQMVADSVGRTLPLFGQSLFQQPPSTFAPVDLTQVPGDYIIGPGDELQINLWGQVQAILRVIVDRAGQIYVPQVGQISVAGVHYGQLEDHLKREISRIFKNFSLTANIGRLRSIQVVVVGNARYPGTYTISSLSTLINAIFASGGPAPQGSLRHIQVRRDGATITDFDFYDLLVKGDKSKDVRLQPGDVLYIPHVGPLVAISGSVNVPAIYEIKDNSSLKDLIDFAGDLSTLADTSKVTIDRVVDHQARKTLEFPYDEQSRSQQVEDGDIVRIFSIVPRFEDTVTLRGNVANPGRYPWKPGMRVSDLIPDAQALLTRGYWRNRADIVNNRATEYRLRSETREGTYDGFVQKNRETGPADATPRTSNTGSAGSVAAIASESNSLDQRPADSTETPAEANANHTSSTQTGAIVPTTTVKNVAEDLRSYAPEINWDYAIIQRVNPQDLSSKVIWMSPRKAILQHDEKSNLELQAGDIVTIFSQRDVSVPLTERSQYVIVEGEVQRPGVYKLEPNETLRSVLERAGGLTPNAYVYASQFTRESARLEQQKSLDELAHMMEVQVRQTAMSVAASSGSADLPQMMAAQEAIIRQLRGTRASGRVALPLEPKDKDPSDFPDMVLEDSDRLTIPHMPSTVAVVGDVYNSGSFIFEPRNSVGAYLEMAGKGKPQSDLRHAFVLRANGVVVAANNVNGMFTGSKFDRIHLYPGDQVVVPYKLPTGAFIRGLRDWTQISSQLALTAAALAVLQ